MKYNVITIGRELGSGGRTTGILIIKANGIISLRNKPVSFMCYSLKL